MKTNIERSKLEQYFESFRNNILGIDQTFKSPFGEKNIVYVDWTASGRLYEPIEEKMLNEFGPFVANTHTETTVSGTTMTQAYHEARKIVKRHVNAHPVNDVLLPSGTGMTGAVNKFQRILGLKIPENFKDRITLKDDERPVIFISHMEHHSNQTSWLETIAKVEVIPCNDDGLFCIENLKTLLEQYKETPLKFASITSCSNVTGIKIPYHEVAKLMHQHGGYCFVDFACSAPYIEIDMHPDDKDAYLDAIFFSPHKADQSRNILHNAEQVGPVTSFSIGSVGIHVFYPAPIVIPGIKPSGFRIEEIPVVLSPFKEQLMLFHLPHILCQLCNTIVIQRELQGPGNRLPRRFFRANMDCSRPSPISLD